MTDTTKKDQYATLVSKRLELSREYTRPYFERFLDNYKHYFLRTIDEMVEDDPDSYPFYSRLSVPISYQTVETILPRAFSQLPTFNIKTDAPNDEKDEQALKDLIRYQMNHPYLIDDPIYLRLATGAKECFITGNMWGTVPWVYKEAKIEKWMPHSPELGFGPSFDVLKATEEFGVPPQWTLQKVKQILIDAPVFNHESVFHVFPDPKKKWVSQLGWIIIERWMTRKEIMDLIKASPRDYMNVEEFKKLPAMAGQTSKYTQYDDELASMFGSSDFATRDDTQGQFLVHEMRTPNHLTIVVNEQLTIRHSSNPNGDGKLGVFLAKDIPIPGELYAWGEPDPIKKIEDSMSDQANMRNDSTFYDLMRMWKLNPEALVEGEEFIPEPGTVVQMSDMTGLEPIAKDTTPASSYREYQEWEQIIQSTTGVTDYTTGQADPTMTKTGIGIQMLQQAANARFQFKLQLFEILCLNAMGAMYVKRNLRFFDTPQYVESGREKVQITPDQIRRLQGNVYFTVDSGSTKAIDDAKNQSKWDKIIGYISKNAPPFNDLTQEAQDLVAKKSLASMEVSEADDIVKRKPPMQTPDAIAAAARGEVSLPVMTPKPVKNGTTEQPTTENPGSIPESAPATE